ncbi:translation elongation factor 4 [Patescibacteria group bacterium]|nr:translation elongation factor 4 [Patescibacteria group bacterium]
MNNIRNFCIIAHIDHGKSTLADRFLELTNTVDKRKMKKQFLDQMELEQERGITIKLQPVRMDYKNYILNLIDTPGHVDFSYEVSRSLAAVEGALLLVDASQGIQAQTLANYHLALEQGLTIIPVINKIDLPNADVKKVEQELVNLLKYKPEKILKVSAKTGQGAEELLDEIVEKVPEPKDINHPTDHILQALIFDSVYDDYKGVLAYVRLKNGQVQAGDKIHFIGTQTNSEVSEVGYFKPNLIKAEKLLNGEIGYIVTGLKKLDQCHVGDTIINNVGTRHGAFLRLPGYKPAKPMVFAGIFCQPGVEPKELREGLEKIQLTDASLSFEPEHSPALGPGFRCGFLGLLHLEIVQERLKREYDLDLVVTAPSVAYKIKKTGSTQEHGANIIHSPQELPPANELEEIQEPWIKLDIITPEKYLGNIMRLATEKRGLYSNTEYLSSDRVILHYEMPLNSILTNFYDKLKSVSSGYASLNYELLDYRVCNVERLDILVADELADSLATIVYKDEAYGIGRKIVDALKDVLSRQMFEIKIQAVLNYQDSGKSKGGKIIASSRVAPYRKDVTAKLYGGDVTRKRKLLEKQKKGKKKMKGIGRGKVEIPTEAYLSVLKR